MAQKWPTAEHGYLIERTDYPSPRFMSGAADEGVQSDQMWGQDCWRAAVPHTYRLLAAPRAGLPFPKPPWSEDIRDRSHLPGPTCTYWSPLLDLLLYSFGWSRPDLGMKWWVDAGRPTDDHRLRLIADLWGHDGRLDQFLAWLWTSPAVPVLHGIHAQVGHTPSTERVEADAAWLRARDAEADASDLPGPYGTSGTDPLHLAFHALEPAEGDPGGTVLLHSSPGDRRAVLLVDNMTGWYRALTEHGASLPDIGQHSWYVDVVVKPVGHLGIYRRSRETGLWFSGPHSLHVWGV